jgi:membrane associated rhomboid family serine protease
LAKTAMPQSRKRHGHPHHKPAAIPAKQRTSGRTIWALLFAIFGALVGLFSSGINYIAIAAGALVGALLGYYVGKTLEKEAAK